MARRVAFVSDASEFAGAERYLTVLAAELATTHDLAAFLPAGAAAETVTRLEGAGVEVTGIVGLGRRPGPPSTLRLARALRRGRPDVVHVNLTDQGDGLAALTAARLAGRPTVATLHLAVPGRARWREAASRLALGLPGRVIAVSEATAAYLRSLGVGSTVVRNGLPAPPTLADARASLGVEAGAFLVGGVGRLDPQKGWDVLCRAAAIVCGRRPEAAFVVVGEGSERAWLEGTAECRFVRFAGYRESASSLLSGFDLLALPSRYEGLPLVAIEAMLAGVPVVAAAVGGVPEVVGEAGVLVPPDDAAALAEAIEGLAASPERRAAVAELGRARALELFTAERMARQTAAVYASLG